jgi:parallel beta-helix repeat protein
MRRTTLLRAVLCGMALLFFNTYSKAPTNYYVGKLVGGASNSNNCTSIATPCLTIGGAIAKMSGGDQLFVMGTTTYSEIINNTIPGSTSFAAATKITAYPGDCPTVQATGSGSAIFYFEGSASKYIIIDGLILDGANLSTVGNIIKVSRVSSNDPAATFIRVQNCEMKNSYSQSVLVTNMSNGCEFLSNTVHDGGKHLDADGLYQYGFYLSSDDNLVAGNEIYGMGSSGIQIFYASGSPLNNTLRDNRIHNNTVLSAAQGRGAGITLSATSAGSGHKVYNNLVYGNYQGIYVSFTSTAKIYNNVVYGSTATAITIASGTSNEVKNNILDANGSQIVNTGTSTSALSNLCRNTGTGCTTVGDPKFMNAAGGDFRLRIDSPAKGNGLDFSSVFTTDIVGLTRVVPWDQGSYKYVDTSAPVVTMTGPASGSTVSGSTVAVTANATDDVAVLGVQFKLDGGNLGAEDTSTPYGVVWDSTTASNALHVLTAVARDAAGNSVTSSAVSVTVANGGVDAAPTVSITSPANGATVSGTITVSANATDDVSVTGVQFKLDGVNLGAEDLSAPYGVSWATTSVSDGSHQLLAVARDGAGHSTTSSLVTVTVSNPPPTISGISAGSITTSGATITWTTSTASNSQVEYGTTTAYGSSTVLDASLVTSHSQALSGLAAFTLYHYRVKSADILGQLATSGDNTFTTAASGATTITVTSPAGGETWIKGSIHAITWTKTADVTGNVRILVSRNGGSTFRTIVNSVAAGALTANWTVTTPSCNNCVIRINSLTAASVFDNSATFSIAVH